MPAEEMVAVQNLSKRFGSQVVIDRLSFRIRQGERLALFAPSGAGKTTLVKILSGLEKANGGDFRIADGAVTIFQEPRLFPFMTVEENIYLPFKALGRAITPADRAACRRWLEVCELAAFTRHYPYQLSGGMKQKTALIRGMLGEPRLVLMDEPFQSIGAEAKQVIIAHLRATNPDLTLLLITHDPDEIRQLAQKVLFFDRPYLTGGAGVSIDLSAPDVLQAGNVNANPCWAPLPFPASPAASLEFINTPRSEGHETKIFSSPCPPCLRG